MADSIEKYTKRGIRSSYLSTIIGISLVLFLTGVVLSGSMALQSIQKQAKEKMATLDSTINNKFIEQDKKINEKIVKLHNTFTTHFVAINHNMYDVILERLLKFDNPIDVIYAGIQKNYNVYCTSTVIAKQLNGFSDIENKIIDYDWLIK
jgi:hypothetical protein